MKGSGILAVVGCMIGWAAHAQSSYVVRFDREVYQIQLGQTFVVDVVYEPATLGGLFSYGVRVSFNELRARVNDAAGISVPASLDHNGVAGAAALRAIGPGYAAVKGTANFFAQPAEYYAGPTLCRIAITDLSTSPGQYQLALNGYNTLGPTESLFVNGAGFVLDDLITFGTATVSVVPEPSALALLCGGGVVLGLSGRWSFAGRPAGVHEGG